jgi:hypothetical protein
MKRHAADLRMFIKLKQLGQKLDAEIAKKRQRTQRNADMGCRPGAA